MNNEKPVAIGEKIRLSHSQFRLLTALGILVASLGHRLPDAACSNHIIDVLFSRQVVTVAALAALLWGIFLGLSSYKAAAEMRQVERCAILLWASYAGSAIGPLLGG
jgi:hypothetical protein